MATGRATREARVEALTIDAYMTLVRLVDPVPALDAALRERGITRSASEIAEAFAAEARYYGPRSHTGRDEPSLKALRRECAHVFLQALDAPLDPSEFAPALTGALHFEPLPAVREALALARERGLRLAVVSNWDVTLPEHLQRTGLLASFDAVVTAAEAGARKPDPRLFEVALERLGTRPERAVHVGDDRADEEGARAAGMGFAPPPLADAIASLA